jgi:hypothetical protein
LLVAPLTELASTDPDRDAAVIGYAAINQMSAALVHGVVPTDADVEHLIGFCLHGVQQSTARMRRR